MSSIILQYHVKSISSNINQSTLHKVNSRELESTIIRVPEEHDLDQERRGLKTKDLLQEINQVTTVKINKLTDQEQKSRLILYRFNRTPRLPRPIVNKTALNMQIPVISASTDFAQHETAYHSQVATDDSLKPIDGFQVPGRRFRQI